MSQKKFSIYIVFGIRTRLLIDEGKITINTFMNVVTTGNQIKEFTYVSLFTSVYHNKIASELSEDLKNWAVAHSLYHKGEYKDCIALTINCKIKHDSLSLKIRTLEIMAYFELLIQEEVYSQVLQQRINSFERKLYRMHQMPIERRNSYTRFLFFLQKMVILFSDIKTKGTDHIELIKLENSIDKEGSLLLKSWLLDNTGKIKKRIAKAIPSQSLSHLLNLQK